MVQSAHPEVTVNERYALTTPLTLHEADQLSEILPYYRTRTSSGRAYHAEFISAEDLRRAELLIAEWRSGR